MNITCKKCDAIDAIAKAQTHEMEESQPADHYEFSVRVFGDEDHKSPIIMASYWHKTPSEASCRLGVKMQLESIREWRQIEDNTQVWIETNVYCMFTSTNGKYEAIVDSKYQKLTK